MRKYLSIVVMALLLAFLTGCADFKSYMKNRGNDLADCFTARVGLNYGIGARVKVTDYFSVSAGCWRCENDIGFFGRDLHQVEVEWWYVGVPISQIIAPIFLTSEEPGIGLGLLLGTGTVFEERGGARSFLLGINANELTDHVVNVFLFPAMIDEVYPTTPHIRHNFFIESGVTLFCFGFDVGFNPVEFVDFLLGWITLDITGDDGVVETERETEP